MPFTIHPHFLDCMSQVPAFISILDLGGNLLWCNRFGYGYDRSILGQPISLVFVEEDRSIWDAAFRRAIEGSQGVRYALRLRVPTPPGWSPISGRLSGVSIGGVVTYVVAVTLDESTPVPVEESHSRCVQGRPRHHEDHVTLSQAAAIIGRSKEALRHYRDLPAPVVAGGGRQRSLYSWAEMRPWLERTFNRKLPERFPSLRPPRG